MLLFVKGNNIKKLPHNQTAYYTSHLILSFLTRFAFRLVVLGNSTLKTLPYAPFPSLLISSNSLRYRDVCA